MSSVWSSSKIVFLLRSQFITTHFPTFGCELRLSARRSISTPAPTAGERRKKNLENRTGELTTFSISKICYHSKSLVSHSSPQFPTIWCDGSSTDSMVCQGPCSQGFSIARYRNLIKNQCIVDSISISTHISGIVISP